MKKLFFTLLAVTAFSCSSDDNNTIAVAPIRLQKMEVRDSDGKLIYIVEYSYENNHLSKSTLSNSDDSVNSNATYSYINDQLIEVTYFNSKGNKKYVEFFVYNDNKIVSVSDIEYYIYNDLNQVIKVQGPQDGTIYDIATYEYDAAGNLVKTTDASGKISNYFTFDNKKTVASLLYPEAVLKIPLYAIPGSNNAIKEDHGDRGVFINEYEYNAAEYPTKKTKKYLDGTVREEITYFYNN